MILIGSQRGGARDLALHLMKDENDHVLVHEVRGFACDDLEGAFNEAYALSRGTRCEKFLFSLSINPPPDRQFTTEEFESAIDRAEDRLGLSGQPRAIVFHEKACADGQQRRHAHAVWSRIETEQMKAVPLPHTRVKLREVSRELHIEHDIEMPRGLADLSKRDPRNFSYEEWQQAQRFGQDPRDRKAAIQDAWSISDTVETFSHALEERGYVLARGDRRGYVAVDMEGEVYSLPRQIGIKTKDVKARLGKSQDLQSVDDAKRKVAEQMSVTASRLEAESQKRAREQAERDKLARHKLIEQQKAERAAIFLHLRQRQEHEAIRRQERFRRGFKGLWDRLNGQHKETRRRNEFEALQAHKRDQKRRDDLIFKQMQARETIRQNERLNRERFIRERTRLHELRTRYEHDQADSLGHNDRDRMKIGMRAQDRYGKHYLER